MRYFDEVLRRHDFVAVDQFSMADITLYAGLLFAEVAGLAVPEECFALREWRVRIAKLPSVKDRSGQALVAQDLRRLGIAA